MHFAEQHRSRARVVAAVAEGVLPRLTTLLRWTPASRIQLVVLDSADFSNGLASPLPFNYTWIFLSPPDEGELLQNREWLEMVLTHELFHVVHLDKARTAPLVLRNIFGRLPFLFPNALQPRWIVEGLAVHAESDPKHGYGRLGQTHFEGMMRAEASRGFRSLAEINAGGRGFPLNRDYLYGAYFFNFIEEHYGLHGVLGIIESYSDNIIPFRVHSNPRFATGKATDELWADYHAWLTARFGRKRDDTREGDVLVRDFSLTSPALAADGTRWFVRADGYTRPVLTRQRPGEEAEGLREIEQDARLATSSGGNVVLAQPDICDNYNYYYDLYRVGPDGKLKRFTDCSRMRFAAPLDDGRTVALRVEDGVAEVVRVGEKTPLYRAAPGEALTGVAARGDLVVVTSLREGRHSLLAIAPDGARVLVSDQAIKHSPRIAERDEVFFVADYGKVYNVWSLRPGGELLRWTEAAHGIKEISAPQRGELLLTTIEPDGDALRIYRLPDEPLERLTAMAPPASEQVQAPAVSGAEKAYSPWYSLMPRSWLPVVEIADGAVMLGVSTFGQDALGVHAYEIVPVYEFTQNEPLGLAAYLYDNRHLFVASRTMQVRSVIEGDNDEDIHSYTITEDAQWVSTWRHLALNRRFYWGLGGALARERLHQVDGPTVSAQDERILGLVAGLDTRRAQWLSEGPSQGLQIRLFAETGRGLHGAFPGDVYRADTRLHLALGKTVLSARWNEAWGEDDAEPFELGGSRTDPAFVVPILNQRVFSLRGYDAGDPVLIGHRARIGTVEWRVPVTDIDRHAMVPPVGINRVSFNLFFDVGAAWDRGEKPDYHRGAGIELMSEIRVGYLGGAALRLGYAKGLDAPGESTFYLRVGRAF